MRLVVLQLKLFVKYLDASWRVRRPSNNLESHCNITSRLLVITHHIVTIGENLPRQSEPAMSATHSALPVVPDITARAES